MPRPPQSSLRWLSLLVVSLLLSPLASSYEMKPDCRSDGQMACFVNNDENKYSNTEVNEKLLTALAALEVRPYSTDKALIRLRTTSTSIKLVYQEDSSKTAIIGCKRTPNGDIVKLTSNEDSMKSFHSEKLRGSGLACEFLYVNTPLFDSTKKIDIVYGEQASEKTAKGATLNQIMNYANNYLKCNVDWLEHDVPVDSEWIYTEPDKRFSNLNCSEGELVYFDEENMPHLADDIICEADPDATGPGTQFVYNIHKSSEKAGETEQKKVACRVQACKKCSSPECTKSATCPTIDEQKGCNVLKCTDTKAKYIKSIDASPTIATQATCKGHTDSGKTDARWMLNDGAVIINATCVEEVHCQDVNPLKLDTSGAANTSGLNTSSSILKCDSGLIKISESRTAKTIKCDGATGEWLAVPHDEDKTVAKDTTISCSVAESATAVAAAGAIFEVPEVVALVIGGLVFFTVIGIVIFCIVSQRRRKKTEANKKIQTIKDNDSKQEQNNLKTAVPLYPPTATVSDPLKKPEPELVEKTTIAQTPDRPTSITMKTVNVNSVPMVERPDGDSTKFADSEKQPSKNYREKEDKPTPITNDKEKEASDGSEPRPIKIGKDGELIQNKTSSKAKSEERSGDKSGQSEVGTTKKEEPRAKTVDKGPKPRNFALDAKQEKIRMGATVKPAEYPTLADIQSDWDSEEERKKVAKKKKKGEKTKTVPTAVTPDVKPTVEPTQDAKTRNTAEKGEDADMNNLLTQMDTTIEQKEADAKRK